MSILFLMRTLYAMMDDIHGYHIEHSDQHTANSMMLSYLTRVDETIQVKTQRLATYLNKNNISRVALIKVDVEEYEYNVLKSLGGYFERTRYTPSIICEKFTPI